MWIHTDIIYKNSREMYEIVRIFQYDAILFLNKLVEFIRWIKLFDVLLVSDLAYNWQAVLPIYR